MYKKKCDATLAKMLVPAIRNPTKYTDPKTIVQIDMNSK